MKVKTPFKRAGYNPTDVFVREDGYEAYVLEEDDGTNCPLFRDVHSGETTYVVLGELRRVHAGRPPETREFLPGSLFKEDWGDVYVLCRLSATELQFYAINSGNRWSDTPFSEPVTPDDLPESFEYLHHAVLEVGVK